MLKRLCLVFAVLLLMTTVACTVMEKPVTDTTAAPSPPSDSDEPRPALPPKDMDGKLFTILCTSWTNYTPLDITDVFAEQSSENGIETKTFERILYMKEKYNCGVGQYDIVSGQELSTILAANRSGDAPYAFALIRSQNFASLVTTGCLCELSVIPHLDLSQPWWDKQSYDSLSILGKHFGLTSSLTTNDELATWVAYFNKRMIEDNDLSDPYQLVRDGVWTYDKLFEMAQTVALDVDNNGIHDEKDRYGISHIRDVLIGVFNSSGVVIAENNSEGIPEFSFTDEASVTRIIDLLTRFYQTDVVINLHNVATGADESQFFMNGNSLFYFSGIYSGNMLRNMNEAYGILPYTVEDQRASYKTFSYKSCADRSASVWCEQLPFTAPGQKTECAPVVISCFPDGDWTAASDRYRRFLTETGWVKAPSESVKTFSGGNGWDLNIYLDNILTKYVASAPAPTAQTLQTSMRLIQRRTGLSCMWITGWHEGGFDTYYPDYTFSERMGGEEGFLRGLEELHEEGGKAILYLNAHMSDIESRWYNTKNEDGVLNGEACATRKPDGSVYEETYPTSGNAVDVAMCPASDAFREAIVSAAEKVRRAGADALYLDQISEMRSYLCFDPNHGHTTPATAYYEGYSKLLNEITDVMDRCGEDWFLLCEGVCDCYGQWIDVFCGYTDTNFLPLTRYTIPNRIIGRDLESENNDTYFNQAFVLGEPFICHRYHVMQSKYTNRNLKRYLAIYESDPALYLNGTYVYRRGLSGSIPSRVDVGVLEGAEGNRSAIQLYNTADIGQARVKFTYTPPKGEVKRAYNAETGEDLLSSDGTIILTLNSRETVSVIITY